MCCEGLQANKVVHYIGFDVGNNLDEYRVDQIQMVYRNRQNTLQPLAL